LGEKVLIIDRVWLSIVAFAKRMIVAFAKRMADAAWFRHQRATSTRNQHTFPESTMFLPQLTASTRIALEELFRNQVQV
jgi:hypothetical protein